MFKEENYSPQHISDMNSYQSKGSKTFFVIPFILDQLYTWECCWTSFLASSSLPQVSTYQYKHKSSVFSVSSEACVVSFPACYLTFMYFIFNVCKYLQIPPLWIKDITCWWLSQKSGSGNAKKENFHFSLQENTHHLPQQKQMIKVDLKHIQFKVKYISKKIFLKKNEII